MSNQVVHFEVVGKDGKKLQQFYGQVFGWNVNANNPMEYGLVEGSGRGIGGGIGASPDESGHVTFYVEVDDLDATLSKVEEMGGKTVMPPTEIPGMVTLAQFQDPEGHLIGLLKTQ